MKSPYDNFNVADIGDCPVNPADLNDTLKKIEKFYTKIASSNTIPISFGGDHLVSLPILRGLKIKNHLDFFSLTHIQILGIVILVIINTHMEHLLEER